MNIKLKFSLILLATLILGIAIGFEVSEISVKVRQEKINSFREANGFVGRFESIIMPDAEQKPVISSILLKYHKIIDSTSKVANTQVSNLIDSMIVQLKKNLKKDQIERFDNEIKRMKNGPPPHPNQGDPGRAPNPDQGPIPNMGPNPNMSFDPNQRPDMNPADKNRQAPFNPSNKLLKPMGQRPSEGSRPSVNNKLPS